MPYHSFETIILPSFLAFVITIIGTEFIMVYLKGAGIIAEDRNKSKPVILPSSGGVAVAFGLIVGILSYTFGGSFLFVPVLDVEKLLSIALSIVLITFVGFLDDVNVKSHRVASTGIKDIRQGLRQWQKPLLTFVGALPLMAINAGVEVVFVPFIGRIALGIFYPLLVLPIAIIFVSNSFNLLGGFDGLQPSMGAIAALGLVIYSFFYGNYMGLFLSSILLASLLGFIPFNTYKAKIIPGDSFTYAVGASLVAVMVMGNAEAFGIIIFMPWILEFFLHLRRRFKVSDLGIRQKDGTFKAPYGRKIYSLTHAVMNLKPMKEKDITRYLSAVEVMFVLLGFGLKLAGLL